MESDVSALARRIMLMEEEDKKSAEGLCATVTKLAIKSKAADNVMKTIKVTDENDGDGDHVCDVYDDNE